MKFKKFAVAAISAGILSSGCGEDETCFGYPPHGQTNPVVGGSPNPTGSPSPGATPNLPSLDSLASKTVTLTDCEGQNHEVKVYASLRANEDSQGRSPGTAEGTLFEGISLSSDGSYVAFSTNALNLLKGQTKRVPIKSHSGDTILLGKNTAAGSAIDSLSKDADDKWLVKYGEFSSLVLNPEGTALAWTSAISDDLMVRVRSENGVRSLKGLIPLGSGESLYDKLSWDTDGHLFVSVYTGGRAGRTMLYDLANRTFTPLTEGLLASVQAVSGDGKLIVLKRETTSKQLVVYNRDTGETVEVAARYGGLFDQDDEACISSDGRFIFYTGTKDTTTHQVYRYNLATRETDVVSTNSQGEQIRFPAGVATRAAADYPQTSSDGRFVTFLAKGSNLPGYSENVVRGLFRKDLQSGELIRLDPSHPERSSRYVDLGIRDYSLSADGSKVAFVINQPLTSGDDPNGDNAYLWDAQAGLRRLGESQQGIAARAPGPSILPDLCFDGSVLAYFSWCTEIFPMIRPDYYDAQRVDVIFTPQS